MAVSSKTAQIIDDLKNTRKPDDKDVVEKAKACIGAVANFDDAMAFVKDHWFKNPALVEASENKAIELAAKRSEINQLLSYIRNNDRRAKLKLKLVGAPD